MRYRFFIFLIAVIFCFDANLLKAQEFDPLSRNGHVSIRTALALRDIRDLKCDGILSDKEWQAADPINKLIVGGNQPYLSKNLTFVRIASDANNLYVGAVCFLAPQEKIGKQDLAWDKDLLTLRLDPGINGRHILQMVFNYKGLESFRDTHESWGFSGRADVTFKGNIFDAKTRELPPLESAKLQQLGSGTAGWCMEAAIPWRYLGNVLQPAEGEVMGLQVSRKTATDEQSFWDRNTFNGFDAQGHIYFVSNPPSLRLEAMTLGRALPGMSLWHFWLHNDGNHADTTHLEIATRQRIENVDFMSAYLESGERQILKSWMPYESGINNLEIKITQSNGNPLYHAKLQNFIDPYETKRTLNSSGGFMAVQLSPSILQPDEKLSVTLNWENDIIGKPPFNCDDPNALSVELVTTRNGHITVSPQEWQTRSADQSGQGQTEFSVTLPKNISDGFVQIQITPFNPGGTQSPTLSADFYLIGKEYDDFARLLQETRRAFESADNMTCEEAYKRHFGTIPPAYYPDDRDPARFTDLFGAKYNVLEGEKLLKGAARNCELLKSIPYYTADLKYRFERLREGDLAETKVATGIQWKSYVSKLDGTRQPYTIAIPREYNARQAWPLIIDLHGYGGGWSQRPDNGKVLAAQTIQCLLVRPYLRGETWYRSWGENEAIQLIENLCAEYNIASNRIHVTGFSMGGSGAMHLLATYPDLFASGGGSSGRAEPLKGWSTSVTPFWTADGFKDQGTTWTGGRMFTLHAAAADAISARHRGDGFAGHYYNLDQQTLYSWMLANPKIEAPRHLNFGVWSARAASLRWIRDVEPERYGRFARITADLEDNDTIRLTTDNVAGLRLDIPHSLLPDTMKELNVIWNGRPINLERANGRVGSLSQPRPAHFKNPGHLAGPIDDFLVKRFVIVQSSNTSTEDAAILQKNIENFNQRWHQYYQGKLEYYTEKTIPRHSLENENLLYVGTTALPSIWPKDREVPLHYDGKWLFIGQKRINAAGSQFLYLTQNPLNAERYMVVIGAENAQNTARALASLFSQTIRHFDFAVLQSKAERSKKISARTDDFARLNNLAAFGWFDMQWQIDPAEALLPDCLFMDNQNPGLVLTPDGYWRDDIPLLPRLREE